MAATMTTYSTAIMAVKGIVQIKSSEIFTSAFARKFYVKMVTLVQSRSLELYLKKTYKTCQFNEERLLFASLNLNIIVQKKASEKCPLY